jgi:hypothetical protein
MARTCRQIWLQPSSPNHNMPRVLSNATDIATALTRVGELLAAEGEAYAIVVVGGAALNLLGIVSRATSDVDILAFRSGDQLVEPPSPLPAPLVRAIRAVARRLDLPEDWLNSGPALQWKQGLPPDLEDHVIWQPPYGGALSVGVVGRADLIALKLYAAADSTGTGSRHYKDLIALAPTQPELLAAAAWAREQDPSPAFATALTTALECVTRDIGVRS